MAGPFGMNRFIETGGGYNPSDAYGTSLMDYAQQHGGSGATQGAPAAPAQASPGGNALLNMQAPDPQENQLSQILALQAAIPRTNALDPSSFMSQPTQNALIPMGAYL